MGVGDETQLKASDLEEFTCLWRPGYLRRPIYRGHACGMSLYPCRSFYEASGNNARSLQAVPAPDQGPEVVKSEVREVLCVTLS